MRNAAASLSSEIFSPASAMAATRDGLATGLLAAAQADARIVVLCADVAESTRTDRFQKEFPDRFIEVGVAEQNLATLASGFAAAGKVPFIATYAAFSPGRNYEQIRTTIALNRANVKICGMHTGVSVGPDGATHQMLEDIGIMRMLPGMVVLSPGDTLEAHKATLAAAKHDGPVYLRFGRAEVPTFTTHETPFAIGKALSLWESAQPKVAILSTGSLSYEALLAARALESEGVGSIVLHNPSIKPLDTDAVLEASRRAGRVITLEEHQSAGGFGSAVAELLGQRYPVRVERVGVEDQFGQSGTPQELLAHYGLTAPALVDRVRAMLKV